MELSNDCLIMLEHLGKPAFFSNNETISYVNTKANAIGINANTPLSEIFRNCLDPDALSSAKAVFNTTINRINYTVTTSAVGNLKLFILEESNEIQQLQSVLRAAQQLRSPLAGLSSAINLLTETNRDSADPNIIKLTQKTTKHLFSLQRSVRNMSDITLFLEDRAGKKETVDTAAYIQELAEKIIQQVCKSGIAISYIGPDEKIYCNIDSTLIERAIYNMISNALKAGSKNIHISLTRKSKTLQLSVQDDGCGMTDDEKNQFLSKFRENPVINAHGYGLGLGMMIIHAAAAAHNGTMLISDIEPHGCKISITIAIESEPLLLKQTPVTIQIDPMGGIDPLLLELSDFLPSEMFL